MADTASIEIRPARRRDAAGLAALLHATAPGSAAAAADAFFLGDLGNHVVAVSGTEVVGAVLVLPGAGHCAAITPPRMLEWDAALAARLSGAAAALAWQRRRARLIQALIPPEDASPLAAALERAGFEVLATLSYMRRPGQPQDRTLEPPAGLRWQCYSRLRHRKFARTIVATYEKSLDCPGLTGLRPVSDTMATHKHTGRFTPQAWRIALADDTPLGVAMVNDLQDRGELVYLGVVPPSRGRGIGRALLDRAIRDSAEMGRSQMGLAVDVANAPAMRLYAGAGFNEIRRRVAYFIPRERLESLALE